MPLEEKYGKRDIRFSLMHREEFPASFTMNDVDWLLYNKNNDAIAMLEEKHMNIKVIDLQSPQIIRHCKMADMLGIPMFVVVVAPRGTEQDAWDHWAFYVIAANDLAADSLSAFGFRSGDRLMSRKEYYRFECHLRGEKPNAQQERLYENELPRVYLPEIRY